MKSNDYYSNARLEILPLLTKKYKYCLDVGCGFAATSSLLLEQKKAEKADGIEVVPEAASLAEKKLSKVYSCDLSFAPSPLEKEKYDLVLCLDVLEHMVDPWAALKKIHAAMAPGADLIISLPNVRNFRVVLPLLLLGRWRYEESGLLDSTHLRFFTRESALELVRTAGFQIERVETTGAQFPRPTWWANLLSFGLFRGLFELQYLVLAKRI